MNREGKGKIEYLDYTWNPITGCLHGCEYCYARRIASRFGGASETHYNECVGEECQWCTEETGETHDLTEPVFDCDRGHNAPYPFGFDPTFHRYRLDEPQKVKKPSIIGVVFMGDLFGDWVPDEWIREVFDACERAPQHTYIFLTKNPRRYAELFRKGVLPSGDKYWYGATFDHSNWADKKAGHDPGDFFFPEVHGRNTFISFEPLLRNFNIGDTGAKWHIIGAETGNRKDKTIPKREWVDHIVDFSRKKGITVFMKESLRQLMGADFIQEWPEGMKGGTDNAK